MLWKILYLISIIMYFFEFFIWLDRNFTLKQLHLKIQSHHRESECLFWYVNKHVKNKQLRIPAFPVASTVHDIKAVEGGF